MSRRKHNARPRRAVPSFFEPLEKRVLLSATDSALTAGSVAMYSWGNEGAFFDDITVTG